MKITFDHAKRHTTRRECGLDFLDAAEVFSGKTLTLIDDRKDYGGVRYQTYGLIGSRVVMVVWADPRSGASRDLHEVLP